MNYILNNLKYSFFDWQKEAFENFLTYQAIKERENVKLQMKFIPKKYWNYITEMEIKDER